MTISLEPVLGRRFAYQPDSWNPALHPAQRSACAAVQAEIDSGALPTEGADCPCGADDGTLVSSRDWFGFHYPLFLCNRCGLLRAGERFTSEGTERFYGTWYRSVYQHPNEQGIEEELAIRADQAERRFQQLWPILEPPPDATVVEIGCNFGHLLKRFRARGMNVWGCDLGSEHLEVGRERLGLDRLVLGDARTLVDRGVGADLVILDHVFEHVAHPLQQLESLMALLRPGGRIFVSVPGTWWWTKHVCSYDLLAVLQNAHCFQYDLETLTDIFASVGLRRLYGDEHVNALFEVSPAPGPSAPDRPHGASALTKLRKLERIRTLRRIIATPAKRLGLSGAAKYWSREPKGR